MAITDFDGFNRLCELCGITESYYDIRGVHHIASFEAKLSLLKAMRITIENDQDIHFNLEKNQLRDWQHILSPVHVYPKSNNDKWIALALSVEQIAQKIHWHIKEDNGQSHTGEWQFETHQASEQCDIAGISHYRFYAQLPNVSDIGYHQLNLQLASEASASALLIVTPDTCFQPESFEAGNKVWGISLQLYSLRSKRNWGIGDFTDLDNVIKILAPLGIDVIGLNPLHTLFSHLPEFASPYSPSSRNFLNPVYLDIEKIEDFEHSEKARQLVNSEGFRDRLNSLRESSLVNYTEVWKAKLEVFELLYEQFRQALLNDDCERDKAFRQYQSDGGQELFLFGLFESLQAYFYQQDSAIKTWQHWPEDFQDPESDRVKAWAKSQLERIEFYQYLQWQSEQQLSVVQSRCKQLGMQIGNYNDLAVGDESFSSTCWIEQSQYALDVSVGAPPDDFNLLGQNWGLPPQLPQLLSDDAYRLFIHTLQSNMRHAGALRIDHIMGLMRLYWVPEGYAADQGTYLSYPFEDLLGILALESQRNRCLIVGEDLGTVPDAVRHQLWLKKILSYRILFFEKDWDQGTFKSPTEYPVHALCTSGSHDLPTLKGYWKSADLDMRENLNLFPSDDIKHQQWQSRGQDCYAIKQALFQEQLITDETLHDDQQSELSSDLFLSIQRFLARSQSLLMMVQLEDMLGQSHQVNVPGTVDEYPNWRHKISINLEDWCSRSDIESIALAINSERKG